MGEHRDSFEKRIARKSALVYVPLSLGAGMLFLLATGWSGSYPPVVRLGGAVWVTLLTLIVSMPLVVSGVKKQHRTGPEENT